EPSTPPHTTAPEPLRLRRRPQQHHQPDRQHRHLEATHGSILAHREHFTRRTVQPIALSTPLLSGPHHPKESGPTARVTCPIDRAATNKPEPKPFARECTPVVHPPP